MIERVNHPHFKLHMDVKAQSAETGTTVPELIRRYARRAGHFHAQDVNLKGPGMGDVDFGPIMQALVASGYDRWVSVEVFDFSPGAEETARQSIACLKQALYVRVPRCHGSLLAARLTRRLRVPERFPVLPFGRIDVDRVAGLDVAGQDAVALHLADPVGARAEAGHVETPVPSVEVLLAGGAHGQQLAGSRGRLCRRRPATGLRVLRVAAESPAAGGLGQRREQDERLLGTGEIEDDVAAGERGAGRRGWAARRRRRVRRRGFAAGSRRGSVVADRRSGCANTDRGGAGGGPVGVRVDLPFSA